MHQAQNQDRSNRACSCGTVYNPARVAPKDVQGVWSDRKTDIHDPCGTLPGIVSISIGRSTGSGCLQADYSIFRDRSEAGMETTSALMLAPSRSGQAAHHQSQSEASASRRLGSRPLQNTHRGQARLQNAASLHIVPLCEPHEGLRTPPLTCGEGETFD